jgi:hypothetical protein
LGVKFGLVGCIMQGVFGLIEAGLLQGAGNLANMATGDVIRELCREMGLFETNPSPQQSTTLRTLLAYVFWRHIPGAVLQQRVSDQYRGAFPAGFVNGQTRVRDNYASLDSNIAKMFTDSLSVLGGMINGAAQEERNRILGKVLNEAMPGEGVTVCFGMRNQ